MRFKNWYIISEAKEEKDLALVFTGDKSILKQLSSVIPQNRKDADKLLLLAAYYYSQNKNALQISRDMGRYIDLLQNNRIPLIQIDLSTKQPPKAYATYILWTQAVHAVESELEKRQAQKFQPSDIDFQNELPITTSTDGKIRVYAANSPQQCIILGRGQKFCISQPANTMWKSYRDEQNSTFYFVYDDTREDALSVVVVDQNAQGVTLTDRNNKTGKTLDPFTGKLTSHPLSYMRYLKQHGVDIHKMVYIEKSKEEEAEDKKLGRRKGSLKWFIMLTPQEKSNYIGRGHTLSYAQFKYLSENKLTSLIHQYLKTGNKIPMNQVEDVAKVSELKKIYLHNRIIAQEQGERDLSALEYQLMSTEQKKTVDEMVPAKHRSVHFATTGNWEAFKASMEKDLLGDFDRAAMNAKNLLDHGAKTNNMTLIEILMDHFGFDEREYTQDMVAAAANKGTLETVKALVNKGLAIGDAPVMAARYGRREILDYFIPKLNQESAEFFEVLSYLTYWTDVDYLKSFVARFKLTGDDISNEDIREAADRHNDEMLKYLVEFTGRVPKDVFMRVVADDKIEMVKWLMDHGAKAQHGLKLAVKKGFKDMVDLLLSGGARLSPEIIMLAKSQEMKEYLTSKLK